MLENFVKYTGADKADGLRCVRLVGDASPSATR